MKRTLERITRKILPLVIAANIIPAINSKISYGQECGESFTTKNMNEVDTEYTLQCNFKGKDRVWTYVDQNGVVQESDRQHWPQGQYNQEVKEAQSGRSAALPPVPPRQVVPLAPKAPSPTKQSEAEQLKAAAEQRIRDDLNNMLDAAEKKSKKEEAERKAKAESQAALDKKKAEEAALAAAQPTPADQLNCEKGFAFDAYDGRCVETVTQTGGAALQSKDSDKGESIYDFAVGTQETGSPRNDSYNIHFAIESGKVPSLSLSFMGNSGNFSAGPFVRAYAENIVSQEKPKSKETLNQFDLVASGIYRKRIDSETLKAIDKYSDSEAGLRFRYGGTFGIVGELGVVEDKQTKYTTRESKVSLTNPTGTTISGPFYATNTSEKTKKGLVPTLGVGLEWEIAKHLTVGGFVHTINGKNIEGKTQLGWRF